MKSQVIFEACESRRLLSAVITSGVLHVNGTAKNDHISLSIQAGDPSTLVVRVNNHVNGFNVNSPRLKLIRIEGRRGNDDILIDQSNGAIKVRTLIFGNAGNDTIAGGAGRDRIHGDEGDDSIIGQ